MALKLRRCDKGYGLFATQDIPRGTRIFTEQALAGYTVEGEALALDAEYQILWKEFKDLLRDPSRHARYLKLAGDPDLDVGREVRDFVQNKCTVKGGLKLPGRRKLRCDELHEAMMRMYAIFYTNCAEKGKSGKYGAGVFPKYSRINHNCTPNVYNSWIRASDSLIAHANRDIKAGEEILSSYIDVAQIEVDRRAELSHWGFRCSCEACCDTPEAETHEARRQMCVDIAQGLRIYTANGKVPSEDDASLQARASEFMPESDEDALTLARRMVQLLLKERIAGRPLFEGYRYCSTLSYRLGNLEDALEYADKELEMEEICLGDNAEYREGDACQYWISELRAKIVGPLRQPRLCMTFADA